jgi:hypothetical protein
VGITVAIDGIIVGLVVVGINVGLVGERVVSILGCVIVGKLVGKKVVGVKLGIFDGKKVGLFDGKKVGCTVGFIVIG